MATELRHKGESATLVLASGLEFKGWSFGAPVSANGEVVFNTAMVGYPEALTDPSYSHQILVLTSPMIGNYGVPGEGVDEQGLSMHFEGARIFVAGVIVVDYSETHSHWNAVRSLGNWLKEHGIPALYGIDTRCLTKYLRELGSTPGKIEFPGKPIEIRDLSGVNLVKEVSSQSIQYFGEGKSPRILAIDCGMKLNIVRYFVHTLNVALIVVPYSYDLEVNAENIEYDGIFISNGPGDPQLCVEPIHTIRWALQQTPPIPIFGICLGNQILALACGAKTYKMKYGNRGMNQPCIDLRTTKCFITSQNHGYAVDNDSLPEDWKALFLNANDLTNEGIVHVSKPYFSVQFHPEACGGPIDTHFLFHDFIDLVRGQPPVRVLVPHQQYERNVLNKVLLVGSGGLSIGQAGEFDYSGSQAIKALKEEGIEVVLINPNIATVQTSRGLGRASPDKVYFLPINKEVVTEIIEKERPDGILVSMGGQTALNVGIELWKDGVLDKYNCRVLGTPIEVIIATEDREVFSQKLVKINEHLAKAFSATSIDEAIVVANEIGYPVLVRSAFALGGLGSGFADNDEELLELARKAFAVSDQILIDQDLRGWKEIEYEVIRDCRDNCITVCNMENFDPLGVHTGDSIVIAPSQTLTNSEYFKLRATSIKVIRSLGIIGECNIQYALNPNSEEYCIVEVNARLSRSSALASKATGYPLAYVATKLCLGKDLVSIRNSINNTTSACFEPSLDYCVIKVPRWDLSKFDKVSTRLGSSMSSVGEVMSIGKTFEEAIQKAIRMVTGGKLKGIDGDDSMNPENGSLDELISNPNDKRIYAIQTAFEHGYTVDRIHELSRIDRWFLARLQHIAQLKMVTKTIDQLSKIDYEAMRLLKCNGFSDRQIAGYIGTDEISVRKHRKDLKVIPYAKQVDTMAGEFPANTNYLYMTYNACEHDITEHLKTSSGGVMVLGCGAYCIGSSVEFDWCAVSAVRQLRTMGEKAIVVNYNPETVSTDYDESDELYFEELTLERVLDIYELENSRGVIVSVGGQIPNNLASPLANNGAVVLGTDPKSIDNAEDRHLFSAMLDKLHIDQPKWSELKSVEDAQQFAETVGFPVLVRPSFVLSGAAMSVASTPEELVNCLASAENISDDKPVVISKYILNAKEIEFDGVARNGELLNYAISEHVENAGVHSGDATLLLPAQKLYVQTVRTVKSMAVQIIRGLNISGPFNIQFLAEGNAVKVIECNLRASRTFPFISKTFNCNFITLATMVMLGAPCKPFHIDLYEYEYVAVKAPMFSFSRLRGADPSLGVEMSSTGEVACFGRDPPEAFLQALLATNFRIPRAKPGHYILLSIANDRNCEEFIDSLRQLIQIGFTIAATPGTAAYYEKQGFTGITVLDKLPDEDTSSSNGALSWIINRKIDLLINISEGTTRKEEVSYGYLMRRAAVDFGATLVTNIKCAILLCEALHRKAPLPCKSADEYLPDVLPPSW